MVISPGAYTNSIGYGEAMSRGTRAKALGWGIAMGAGLFHVQMMLTFA